MKRNIDIENEKHKLNLWVKKSIELFQETSYLDDIQSIYHFKMSTPQRLPNNVKRELYMAHYERDITRLLSLLTGQTKFPYEDPIWYMLKQVKDCFDKNPRQLKRIADALYSFTLDETILRLESPPKLNTQAGQMFRNWVYQKFPVLSKKEFMEVEEGIHLLGGSEEEGKTLVQSHLEQDVDKRPDLVAKAGTQYVIGEAKWVGQPGGNQTKQVTEVLDFCNKQRGNVRRVGIVDGFPWAIYHTNDRIIENKEAIMIQEAPYDILTALLIEEYLKQFV